MKNNFKHDVGKKISSVTWMPPFMLSVQGWLDSRKSETSIPDARIEGMKQKCMSIEKLEALTIENLYSSVREEGAKTLVQFYDCFKNEKPVFANINTDDPCMIRAKARFESKQAAERDNAKQAKLKLVEIKEALVHADTVLCERIRRTREKALNVKIAAYVKGVRKGKIPDYTPDLSLSDDAYNIYIEKHRPCDEAIFSAAEEFTFAKE